MDAEKSYESKIKARREAKRQIIEAAADLIRESGHYYVTLDQIAERLHISKVSIYHHWTSKQEILFDLLRIGYKAFVENLEKIVKSENPPDVKLQSAIENHVAQAVNSGINPMLGDQEWHLVNKYRKEIIKLRDIYDQMFYQIINDGIDQGIFKQIDAKLLHFTIMGATNYTWLWYSAKGGMSYKEIANHITSFLLDGVRAGAPGKKK